MSFNDVVFVFVNALLNSKKLVAESHKLFLLQKTKKDLKLYKSCV